MDLRGLEGISLDLRGLGGGGVSLDLGVYRELAWTLGRFLIRLGMCKKNSGTPELRPLTVDVKLVLTSEVVFVLNQYVSGV